MTWGTGLVDFDNDGDRDLFVACGHLQPNVEAYDKRTTYHQPNKLYVNDGRADSSMLRSQRRRARGRLEQPRRPPSTIWTTTAT